jgi:hypothetical protein
VWEWRERTASKVECACVRLSGCSEAYSGCSSTLSPASCSARGAASTQTRRAQRGTRPAGGSSRSAQRKRRGGDDRRACVCACAGASQLNAAAGQPHCMCRAASLGARTLRTPPYCSPSRLQTAPPSPCGTLGRPCPSICSAWGTAVWPSRRGEQRGTVGGAAGRDRHQQPSTAVFSAPSRLRAPSGPQAGAPVSNHGAGCGGSASPAARRRVA